MSGFRGLGSKSNVGRFIFFFAAFPRQILNVVKGDVNHKHDQRGSTAGLNHADDPRADGFAANAFDDREKDMAAVENWARLGARRALTGPIVRGDAVTAARQRDAVAARTPELLPLWDALTEATRALARGKGS